MPKRRTFATFDQVLFNIDDQQTVRALVRELLPPKLKAELLRRYNEEMERINAKLEND